ncbi:ribosome small subunit-dependent GTPase A [Thalassobacillus pellis]|uniref:ribosome small subunit-dependent GTPase A n=1 Tax=Thalassobacillus pellis TaxID=748008 RepID=UPI00195FADC4|nr:ribosome small subunit-dependent GTPase A [Thalassobacillus pellis]MBM7553005.1 ribosome biogenesis GTPase [Thalassobacillus pellis]
MENWTWNSLGLQDFFANQTAVDEIYGRVIKAGSGHYLIQTPEKLYDGQVSGKFHFHSADPRDYPCVGDWVIFTPLTGEDKAVINRILDRKTILMRHAAGDNTKEQLMAANVDVVFLVNALDKDFNLRRMERYLMQVYESGAKPVFILTKADLAEEVQDKVKLVEAIAPGVAVYAIDSLSGSGVDEIKKELIEGQTISLIGSSGAGKSTLINLLTGRELQKTQEVRASDQKGKHTTTHREMFLLPEGPAIIDTPGMRELQLWGDSDTVDMAFSDIDALSENCKFRDCKHGSEPGCAVNEAIEKGVLTSERLKNYRKMLREVERLDLKEKYGAHKTNRMLYGPKGIR